MGALCLRALGLVCHTETSRPRAWAQVSNCTKPENLYDNGNAARPCKELTDQHPMVAEEVNWRANGSRTPQQETVTASSKVKAALKCSQRGQT